MKPANLLRARYIAKKINRPGSVETNIIDALTNLRHLCDRERLDFDNLNRIAANHYLSEKEPTR